MRTVDWFVSDGRESPAPLKQSSMSEQKKNYRIYIRVTEEERIIINELAQRAGMTLSKFIILSILNGKITVNEIDTQAILKPLLGLQRHYNTIRNWMIQHNYSNPILKDSYKKEIENLWQLLAQAKAPIVQKDL